MLVGYVSDENDVALSGVSVEFEDGTASVEARSRASGAVYADLTPGDYTAHLSRSGYGAKRVPLTVAELVIEGTLRYQVCDDKLCYLPEEVPLEWRFQLEPHDRTRVPEKAQSGSGR